MNSPAMDRFETIVNFVVSEDDKRATLLKAADRLLADMAMEMGETTATALGLILLQVYKDGAVPGRSSNAVINELTDILVAARRQHATDSTD